MLITKNWIKFNYEKIFIYGHLLFLSDYQYFKNRFDRTHLSANSTVELYYKFSNVNQKEPFSEKSYVSLFNPLRRYWKGYYNYAYIRK